MGAASKRKGGNFEREVCVKLSLWVSAGESRDLFWRSAMSGGRASRGHARGETLRRQAGDICAVAPEGHVLTDEFYIELKHVKSLDAGSFFVTGRGRLAEFWTKAVRESARYDRQPMLIARQNHLATIMVIPNGRPGRFCVPVATSVTLQARVYKFDEVLMEPFRS